MFAHTKLDLRMSVAHDILRSNANTHKQVNDIAQRKLIQIRGERQCPSAHQLECKRLMCFEILTDKRQSRRLQLISSFHKKKLIEGPEITFQPYLVWRRPKVR